MNDHREKKNGSDPLKAGGKEKAAGKSAREAAADSVFNILEKKKPSHIETAETLKKSSGLSDRDRAFYVRLVKGTVERAIELDVIINSFSTTETKKIRPFIRCLLRVSVYQIMHMDHVPDSAAVNETVKIARKRGFSGLSGFVNAVLRAVSAGKEGVPVLGEKDNPATRLSVRFSMPKFLVEKFTEDYGEKNASLIMQSFLCERPLTARVNTSRADIDDVIRMIEADGAKAERAGFYDGAIVIEEATSPENLRAFKEGLIYYQSEGSILAGAMLTPAPGSIVADVCAAPGAKCLHAADMLSGSGMVFAFDASETKIKKLNENIKRCGFKNITASLHDARSADERLIGKCDAVIADLPCSGLGQIGIKPDIKYNITPEKIKSLVKLQREILSAASLYVKPGGHLIYSTCTINPQENEENAAWFEENFSFKRVSPGDVPAAFSSHPGADVPAALSLIPGVTGTDGFYAVKFVRT